MSARANALVTPLAIVQAAACGSSGLNARALGAAMWSRAARFELLSAEHFGVADIVRVAMCPLFDRGTPWPERLTSLLRGVLIDVPTRWLHQAKAIHLISPSVAPKTMFAPPHEGLSFVIEHNTDQSFVDVLRHVAAQLQALAAGSHVTVAAVDSLMSQELLVPLHASGALSTEQNACGIIPSEAAAVFTVRALTPSCTPWSHGMLGIIHGACAVPFGPSPAQALIAAIEGAVTNAASAHAVHTVLWDIGANSYLVSVAETISALSPLLQDALLMRPLQYIGCTGGAFGAVATVLALEGCRAGITPGGRTLICTLNDNTASAILVEAPWHPPIMLADAQETPP